MSVLSEAMKMFELECSKADIQLQFQGDASLSLAGFHGLMLDPSRLIQVSLSSVHCNTFTEDLFRFQQIRGRGRLSTVLHL